MRLPGAIRLLVLPLIPLGSVPALGGAATSVREIPPASRDGVEKPLRMNVDEVVVTFHATDANGASVTGLAADDIRIRDNGAAPKRILAFDELRNRPIRVGILLDASASLQQGLELNKEIARKFVERLFRSGSDRGFVSSFGYGSDVLRSWTGDQEQLVRGIESAREESDTHGGTALFNAVFRACSYSFEQADPKTTGNVLLLFTDGEDNAGLTSPEEAARACQRSNTAVFGFLSSSSVGPGSTGPKALRELAARTGGSVFRAEDSEGAIWSDLGEIESEMRNQYRLVYTPAELKHDGAFHEIELQPPNRVKRIVVRSGYFAPRE